MEETQNKYENSLFHYTNAKGLLGILDTKKLWATAIHCVNDQSESIHFSLILLKKINLRFSEDIYKDMYYAINKREISIEFIQEIVDEFLALKHFITCFTLIKSDDEYDDGLLSQWRGYGDDGVYAIEFDKENLEKLIKALNDKNVKIISKKVTYSEQTNEWEWENFFETHIEKKINQKQKDLSTRSYNDSDRLIPDDKILDYISSNAPFCKNPHFSEEKESRISYGIDKNTNCHFTNRNGLIIPYIELDFDIISCINRIIIGPSPRIDDRVRSIKALLESCIKKTRIRC